MSSFKLSLAAGCAALTFAACGPSSNSGDGTVDANAGGSNGSNGSNGNNGSNGSNTPPGTGYALTSPDGVAWLAMVTVGGHPFAMDVDTGSTTLGVAGASCSTCGVTPTYSPGTGAMDSGQSTEADYGLGEWTGEIYSDAVAFQGDASNVTMGFGNISSQMQFFQDNSEQGIIGMGPADLALPGTDAYLVKRGAGTIAFQLCPSDGALWIDTTDSSKMSGTLQYEPMLAPISKAANPYWEVQVQSGSIGGTGKLTGAAVLDTGTTLIIASTTAANGILKDMEKASGYASVFGTQKPTLLSAANPVCLDPGSTTNTAIDAALPPLTMKLGTQTLTLPATQSYLFFTQGQYCFAIDGDDDLTAGGIGMILGDAFLRHFVVQFDMQNMRAGFSPEVGCALPEAHPSRPAKPFVMPHWHRPNRVQH